MSNAALAANREVRVLIVDDSPFMRRSIEKLLLQEPRVRIIGSAADGIEAVQKVAQLRPDVVTMDVTMPRMDGVAAVEEIMSVVPTPIVMVSTLTREGSDTAIRALEAGAVECVAKPAGVAGELESVGEELASAVLRAGEAVVRRRSRSAKSATMLERPQEIHRTSIPSRRVVVIGASTGGPPALTALIPGLSADCLAGVLVVQHMAAGFTAALARRLDAISPLHVREAAEGDLVCAGTVLIAPGNQHLTIGDDRRVHLNRSAPVHGVRPAIDVALGAITAVYGRETTVAILTGMGRDGAEGAAMAEAAGGTVFVQDEATSVIYGMPRVAKELTRAAVALPISEMAAAISGSLGAR